MFKALTQVTPVVILAMLFWNISALAYFTPCSVTMLDSKGQAVAVCDASGKCKPLPGTPAPGWKRPSQKKVRK